MMFFLSVANNKTFKDVYVRLKASHLMEMTMNLF